MNLQVIAIVTAIALAVGGSGGYWVGAAKYERILLRAKDEANAQYQLSLKRLRQAERSNQVITDKLATKHAKVITEIEVVEREIEKEVIRYVQNTADNCQLDSEWLRLHNLASQPRVSAHTSTASTDDGSSE